MKSRLRLERLFVAIGFAIGLLSTSATAETLVGWRTDGTGRYTVANPPTQWSTEENVAWKTELPGNSFGSPIVVGERIFVISEPAELLCLRATDGKILWQRSHAHAELYGEEKGKQIEDSFAALEDEKKRWRREHNDLRKSNPEAKEKLDQLNEKSRDVEKKIREMMKHSAPPIRRGGSGNTAATPVTDGKRVFAVFGNGIVSAHDLDGRRLWMRFVEGSNIGFGHSSSPVLAGGKVVVHFHDLVAIDASSSQEAWRVELPARHATPIASRIGDTDVIIAPSGAIVRVADGHLLAEKLFDVSECSPVLNDGILYAQSGKIRALKLPSKPSETVEPELLWEIKASSGRRTPSPVYHEGLLYGITTNGILDVTDVITGENVYRKRMDVGRNLYSSVTVGGRYVYLSGTNGTTVVLQAGREYQEVTRNQLESFGSNPVFVDRRMYIRTRKHLYCIGK